MYFCVYCGKSFQDKLHFCPFCGKEQPQLEKTPVPVPAASEVAVYPVTEPHTAYSFAAAPEMSRPAKIFGKLAFFLGLGALCAAGLMIILVAALLIADFSFPLSIEMISAPLGIAAIVFSFLARKKGNHLRQPLLGRIFGIIALALTVVIIILFFLYVRDAMSSVFDDFPDFSL